MATNFDDWVIARTDIGTLAGTDLFAVVDDPAGTPSTMKLTASAAKSFFGTSQPFTKTADYTLDAVDGGCTFIMNSSSPLKLYVPTHAAEDIEYYSFVQVIQAGTGTVTVEAVTPATTSIRSLSNLYSLAGQYASATLYKADTDVWYLSGALT